MIGVAKGKLPCYICKTGSPSVVNHANIRNKDIVNKFSQPVGTEDLLFVYHGLATKGSHESNDAVDTVKTLCLYRKTSPEDTAALLKIIGWPITQLEKLIEVNSFHLSAICYTFHIYVGRYTLKKTFLPCKACVIRMGGIGYIFSF